MPRQFIYVIILFLIGVLRVDAAFYRVLLEPDKAEREVIHIDPGPLTAELTLQPKDTSWRIRNSAIVAPDDDFLWSGPYGYYAGSLPTPYLHMYLLLTGHSSREYVKIEGNLFKGGGGGGRSPWFRVTVPDVDIDWEGYEEKKDEEEEDTRKVYCPVESDVSKCRKFIVRNPLDSGNIRDDSSLLGRYKDVVLSWIPVNSFKIKDISGNEFANGGSISLTTTQIWPLELYVVSEPNKLLSDIIITLKGPAGPDGKRPEDKIKGTGVKVFIERCSAAWSPKGGDEDNIVTIRAYVIPDNIKGKFKFTLFEVSDEKGYCLNAPVKIPLSGEDSDAWKDLQFVKTQSGYYVSGDDNDEAGLETASSDIEHQPTGAGVNGDNFTRYEEYRGFISVNGHIRTDTSKKTALIVNKTEESWSIVTFGPGQLGYELINIPESMMTAGQVINNNSETYSSDVPVYAVVLERVGLPPGVLGSCDAKIDNKSRCQFDLYKLLVLSNYDTALYEALKKYIFGHEIGHALYLSPPDSMGTTHGHDVGYYKDCFMDIKDPYDNTPPTSYCTVAGDRNYKCSVHHSIKGH